MSFRLLLQDIADWQTTTFPKADTTSKLHHLKEEVQELIDAVEEGDPVKIEKEFADCFLLLFGAADCRGFGWSSIKEIMRNKLDINKLRSWGLPDQNGVVHHIKTT